MSAAPEASLGCCRQEGAGGSLQIGPQDLHQAIGSLSLWGCRVASLAPVGDVMVSTGEAQADP